MKKTLCILIATMMLWSMAVIALAEKTQAQAPTILEQLGKAWDYVLSLLGGEKQAPLEKKLNEWKEQGAYIAEMEIYVLNRRAPANVDVFDGSGGSLMAFLVKNLSGQEALRAIQRSVPAFSDLSLKDLGDRIYIYNAEGTQVISLYAASYQNGEEALALAQTAYDALRTFSEGISNQGELVVLSFPTLMN